MGKAVINWFELKLARKNTLHTMPKTNKKNMLYRLYFITQAEEVCEDIEASLIAEGVDENRVFVFDNLSEEMVSLPDSSAWKRRLVPPFVLGILLGGLAGLLAGWLRLQVDSQLSFNLIMGVGLAGAIAGGLMFWLAASDEHEKRIKQYQYSVDLDGFLVVADAPQNMYRKLHAMVVARHPAKYLGVVPHSRLQRKS